MEVRLGRALANFNANEIIGAAIAPSPTGRNCSWNRGSSAPKSSRLCDKNGASGKRCDIDGQPERASVWANASQYEELTAIFVTITKASEDFLIHFLIGHLRSRARASYPRCITARRRHAGPSRAAWWCFAAALLLFALAEITWGALYSGGGDVPSPNPTDALYLSTYPLFMAGLVLMVRARVLDVPWHRWLDGFVLVLIVATPGVLLLIEPVLVNAPIDLLGQIVTVAYPLGDLLLLGALLGSLPLLSWRLGGSWPWVGVGLVCLTVADAAYSLTAADVVAHDGPYDFLWSAGALAFAVGATRLPSPARPSREITGWPAIVLPLGAQLFAVATQVYGYFRPLPAAERLLTIAVLIVGIAQIIVSRPRPDPERVATEPSNSSPASP